MVSQEVVRGTVHQFVDVDNDLNLNDVGDGCHVKGTVVTDKVGGNFRFQVKPDKQHVEPAAVHTIIPQPHHYANLDMSHEVYNIYFEGQHDLVQKLLGNLASPQTPLKNQVTHLSEGSAKVYIYYSMYDV